MYKSHEQELHDSIQECRKSLEAVLDKIELYLSEKAHNRRKQTKTTRTQRKRL